MRWLCNLFTPNPMEVRRKLLLETELELIRAQAHLDAADCRVFQLETTVQRLRSEVLGPQNG